MRNLQQDLEICSRATKGPWRAGRADMATVVDGYDSKWIYAGEKYVAIASGQDIESWDEVMANAYLMAMSREALPHYIGLLKQIAAMAKLPENRRAYTQQQACVFMDQLVRLIENAESTWICYDCCAEMPVPSEVGVE